jgi:protein-S-isoprenylcysteine O-methyltransferase Ste14
MNNSELFVLILFWIGWCILHSAMISLGTTSYLKRKLGESFKYYRLFYNVTALLTLIPLYLVSLSMKGELVFSWSGSLRGVQLILFAGSLLLFVVGARHYDLANFLGFAQIRSGNNNSVMSESGKLDTSGILGITRHPWYLAGLILIWTSQQDIHATRFWINAVLSAYFIIGALLEERKLRIELGQSYRDYCEQVSMLIPFKWIKKNLLPR